MEEGRTSGKRGEPREREESLVADRPGRASGQKGEPRGRRESLGAEGRASWKKREPRKKDEPRKRTESLVKEGEPPSLGNEGGGTIYLKSLGRKVR